MNELKTRLSNCIVEERANGTRSVKLICGVSLTKQSEASSCDMNKIMDRYMKTGRLPDMINKGSISGDFTKVEDYRDSIEKVRLAEQQFENLPMKVKKMCMNNINNFLELCEKSSIEELVKLGILHKNSIKENIQKVEIINKEDPKIEKASPAKPDAAASPEGKEGE